MPFVILNLIYGFSSLYWIFSVWNWRGSHSGFVCAGYYLPENKRDTQLVLGLYDIDRGLFLYVLMAFQLTIIPIACCVLCFFAVTKNNFRYSELWRFWINLKYQIHWSLVDRSWILLGIIEMRGVFHLKYVFTFVIATYQVIDC